MEKRQIIVLSKSSKYQDYCVAGIDIYTGEWIRPITNNTVKENGIPKNAFVDNLTKKKHRTSRCNRSQFRKKRYEYTTARELYISEL